MVIIPWMYDDSVYTEVENTHKISRIFLCREAREPPPTFKKHHHPAPLVPRPTTLYKSNKDREKSLRKLVMNNP